MKDKLQSFEVIKLHGYKNYKLVFKDNIIILVGENGSGKTTVLRLLYYLLSGQINLLSQFNFKKIILSLNNKEHIIRSELLKNKKIDEHLLRYLPPNLRKKAISIIENNPDSPELYHLFDKYHLPIDFIERTLDDYSCNYDEEIIDDLRDIIKSISDSIHSQILYLPTYRRIEQELNFIFRGIDKDNYQKRRKIYAHNESDRSSVELIEFGMNDVNQSIKETENSLKEFARLTMNKLTLGYLGDVVDKEYLNVDIQEIQEASEKSIQSILDRIDESILSKTHKEHLFKRITIVRNGGTLDEHAKVICHYFLKLLKFQQELIEKEKQISSFCNVCNQYMKDKCFSYDSKSFMFSIRSKTRIGKEMEIRLKDLSSGEKQIVSLFSHLYLSKQKNFIVLIDEPELSLSVPWQRRFLIDIIEGGFCSGLIAATHSPFIYDNNLRKYAHGLGEFQY